MTTFFHSLKQINTPEMLQGARRPSRRVSSSGASVSSTTPSSPTSPSARRSTFDSIYYIPEAPKSYSNYPDDTTIDEYDCLDDSERSEYENTWLKTINYFITPTIHCHQEEKRGNYTDAWLNSIGYETHHQEENDSGSVTSTQETSSVPAANAMMKEVSTTTFTANVSRQRLIDASDTSGSTTASYTTSEFTTAADSFVDAEELQNNENDSDGHAWFQQQFFPTPQQGYTFPSSPAALQQEATDDSSGWVISSDLSIPQRAATSITPQGRSGDDGGWPSSVAPQHKSVDNSGWGSSNVNFSQDFTTSVVPQERSFEDGGGWGGSIKKPSQGFTTPIAPQERSFDYGGGWGSSERKSSEDVATSPFAADIPWGSGEINFKQETKTDNDTGWSSRSFAVSQENTSFSGGGQYGNFSHDSATYSAPPQDNNGGNGNKNWKLNIPNVASSTPQDWKLFAEQNEKSFGSLVTLDSPPLTADKKDAGESSATHQEASDDLSIPAIQEAVKKAIQEMVDNEKDTGENAAHQEEVLVNNTPATVVQEQQQKVEVVDSRIKYTRSDLLAVLNQAQGKDTQVGVLAGRLLEVYMTVDTCDLGKESSRVAKPIIDQGGDLDSVIQNVPDVATCYPIRKPRNSPERDAKGFSPGVPCAKHTTAADTEKYLFIKSRLGRGKQA